MTKFNYASKISVFSRQPQNFRPIFFKKTSCFAHILPNLCFFSGFGTRNAHFFATFAENLLRNESIQIFGYNVVPDSYGHYGTRIATAAVSTDRHGKG